MENTHKDARAREQAGAQLASIEELVTCLEHAAACDNTECGADCTHNEDEAREAILADALSVQVRSDWHTPGGTADAGDWVFRTTTLACIHATFPLLLYESACNSSGSMSTKRQ